MRILAVGIATLDIINTVPAYPQEDDELRVLSQTVVRGGNATNTLAVLSQHGHDCHWAGVLPHEPDARIVTADLEHYQINYQACERPAAGKLPTSYITLSKNTGKRTILHYRDTPEFSFRAFDRIDLQSFDWIHFEGRNVTQLEKMLNKTRQLNIRSSLEVEKPRVAIEKLLEWPDVLMCSRQYAISRGAQKLEDFFDLPLPSDKPVYLAWGDQGGMVRSADGNLHRSHAYVPHKIINTVGAGDVFNAEIIHGHLQGKPESEILISACKQAGYKCGQPGLKIDANI